MRDPKRIKRILKLIEKIWTKYPDLRLGQLLQNFAGFTRKDNWNVEDDTTESFLKGYVDMLTMQEHFKKTGEFVCFKCKIPFKKLDKHTFQPDCKHYNKDLRLSVG